MDAARTTPDGRYLVLDSYRFLAALAIVCFHYNYDFRLGLGDLSRAFDKLHVYVDLFFVLSGFVIAEAYAGKVGSPRDYATFLRRRVARVYPLHLAVLLALAGGVAIGRATGRLDPVPDMFAPAAFPASLLMLNAWGLTELQTWNIPSWSISAELLVYLLFPALLWVAVRLPAWGTLLLAAGAALALAEVRRRLGLFDWTDATTDGAPRAVPTFLAGIAVSRGMARATWLPRVPWPLAHAAFLAPLALMHLGAPAWTAIATFPAVVALAAAAERGGRGTALAGRPCVALGHASYALYLVHFPMVLLVTRVPGWELPDAVGARAALAVATAAASVGLALALHARFERPAQAWVNGTARRDRPPGRAGSASDADGATSLPCVGAGEAGRRREAA